MSTDEVVAKLAVAELAQRERAARDRMLWEVMSECYVAEGSRVYLSWFDGSATEFIAGSRAMSTAPGGHAIHSLGPSTVRVNGDRALVETPCTILFRRVFDGVECDLTAYCRHHSRVVREHGEWRLVTLVGVYEKNTLAPVVPGTAPAIDVARLGTFRSSYAFQAYFRAQEGKPVHDDRPGLDRPELVERFLDAEEKWLAGADTALGVGDPDRADDHGMARER